MQHHCGKPDDLSFGPAIAHCHRPFDFTLWFEELVFVVIPSTTFIVGALPRLWYLRRSSTVTLGGATHKAKLVFDAVLVSVQCLLIVETARGKSSTPISACAASLLTAATILLCLLSHYEHVRSVRPPALSIIFLSLTTLFDGVRIRTHFSIGNVGLVAILSIGVALKLLLLLLESKSKKHHVLDRYREKSPEELAGPISRTFFYWLHPLLRRGYKEFLSIDDIGRIDHGLFSSSISNRLSSTGFQGKKGGLSTHGLTWLLLRCLGRNALYPIVPRLALSAFTFAQPFLVNAMLSELSDHDLRDMSAGYGLIGATLLVYVGIAVSNAWYWQLINRSVTIVRGSLVILLFDKLFQLKEDASMESRAMTLMFSDTQRIMNTLNYAHELWAGILETAIATWLLYRQTGSASFAMLGVSIVSSASCIGLSKAISRKQQAWLAAVDQRLGPTKRMLSSLKAIKMLSAGERTTKALNHLRKVELRTSWPFRRLRIVTVVLSYSTMTLSPPIVFAVYMGVYPNSSESLNVTKLFTSLTLISLLATPLMHLCQAIPAFGAAHGCLKRIQSFLEIEEREEPRTFFSNDSLSDSNDNTPGQTTPHLSQHANSPVLSIKEASFGWEKSKAVLKDVNLDIRQGSKMAIFGRVGCGKSLLLKGLLGEAAQMAGEVKVRHGLRFAYCSQTPWLENLSVQMNLTQYATDLEDQKVLDNLVYKCSLQDLVNLADYQAGTIGSGGVKLSGGQRQRLALARALALRRDVLLLDDVFSALDRRTRLHIARNLLGPGMSADLAPVTIVYATHDEQIASLADEVYEITESGTLQKRSDLGTTADTEEVSSSYQHVEPSLAPRTKTQGRDENPPDAKKLLGDRVVYKTYLQSMGVTHSILFLLIGASFAVTFKFPDIWIQWWSAAVSAENHDHSARYWMSVYAVLEILPLATLSLWIWHLFHNVVPAVGTSLHGSLLQTVMAASFPFISSVDTGSIINRFNQDLMLVDSLLPFDLFNTVSELFVAIIQVVFIAVASVPALAVLPVVVVVLYTIQHFYLQTSKQLRLLELEAKAALHTKVSDVAGHAGPSMIRAHGWQDVTRNNFMQRLDASQKPVYLLFSVQRWLQLVLNLVVAGLVVIVAGVAVAVKTEANVGAVGVAFLNASTLGETLTQFVLAWTSLETSLGAVARIALFERDTPSEQDGPSSSDTARSAWRPASGEVVFDNVWATYTAGSSLQQDSDASWSLRGVSFKVRAGEHVAICGRTGSGKSTLLLALLRMVDIPVGSIYVDHVDHSKLPLDLLRRGFFVISQDVLEESVSIRQQLDPESAFSDGEIEDALIQCDLWTRVDLDGGLSSTATDMKLSVGEMQLLSLARTLLYAGSRDGGVVILDEATSNLDRETQQKIDSLVDLKLKNKTILSVSHRLTSALASDRIIIMEHGQIMHDAAPSYVIEHAELFSGLKLQGLKEDE